ncbi:hypothetical protein CW731_00895 [Polaribacter sp. ALD11]|uniref:hypothetical protein n=1 Tax=Polaribacter sp. ALD11 TaxID=2058137 RepID=UPI000C3103E5|nr:hypothetical protein [Polaribacter sp. ALD11]AUC83931.1 hypothetical protein CW731_00895 [Polaribacter sp. ALD11]
MENNINNSEDFLKQVLNKSTGFSVPKNYFSDAEDRFSSFLIEDELPKENGFIIPENYFEGLENSIIKKIATKKEVKVISLKNKLLKYIPIATAASVALFLSINYFNTYSNEEVSFENLAQSDIENWIIENSNELSDQDFATLLHSEITNENDFALTDLNNNDIEEYIIDSGSTSLLNENY